MSRRSFATHIPASWNSALAACGQGDVSLAAMTAGAASGIVEHVMAYVECVRCGLTAYSAARWSTIDDCARCGAPLPHRARSVTPIARHPRFAAQRTGRPATAAPHEHPPAA